MVAVLIHACARIATMMASSLHGPSTNFNSCMREDCNTELKSPVLLGWHFDSCIREDCNGR